MTDSPVDKVRRWQESGAMVRVVRRSATHVVLDLCTCTGEPVERLASGDRELLDYLARLVPTDPA